MEKIEISYKTILFTVFLLLSLFFLYQARKIILLLFVCLIFTAAFGPLINKIQKFKIPRPLAIMIFYFFIIGGLIATIASIAPVLISQTEALLNNLPRFLDEIGFFKLDIALSDYSDRLLDVPANVFKFAASALSNIIGIFAFLVINFYLMMERGNLKKHLHFLFSENGEKKVETLILRLEKELGGWVRAQVLLMMIIGLMSYVGLKFLDLEFALPLALIAGLLEIIPNIGPTVSMIPAIIVGFASSPVMGLAVVALYFLIQQLENNLIVPKVLQKAIGLHPLITIIALMTGLKLGGVVGSLLAIPAILFIKVIIEQLYLPTRTPKKSVRS